MLQFESHHTLSQAQGATGAHRPTPTGTSSNIAKKKQLVQVATFRFRLTDCTDKETSLFFFLPFSGADGRGFGWFSSCILFDELQTGAPEGRQGRLLALATKITA